ncbi:hypothetical protein E2C01_076636 [Portunus trituberculatus]|uniref:Uncharacterized protein n=1 Tax=Portunus trituberculatus TaxID=210409 RepID=A0A5B7IP29_PORTR|nr:hypothetical protein [Portunus trituberculatus]
MPSETETSAGVRSKRRLYSNGSEGLNKYYVSPSPDTPWPAPEISFPTRRTFPTGAMEPRTLVQGSPSARVRILATVGVGRASLLGSTVSLQMGFQIGDAQKVPPLAHKFP